MLGTSLASAFVFVPSLSGGSGGSGGGWGGWGSGGGGGGGGPGGGSGGAAGPLFDIAAADKKAEEAEESSAGVEDVAAKDDKQGKNSNWKGLITEEEEGGEGSPDNRTGTLRCVEVVIEGWPEVGALPKKVGFKFHYGLFPCRSTFGS